MRVVSLGLTTTPELHKLSSEPTSNCSKFSQLPPSPHARELRAAVQCLTSTYSFSYAQRRHRTSTAAISRPFVDPARRSSPIMARTRRRAYTGSGILQTQKYLGRTGVRPGRHFGYLPAGMPINPGEPCTDTGESSPSRQPHTQYPWPKMSAPPVWSSLIDWRGSPARMVLGAESFIAVESWHHGASVPHADPERHRSHDHVLTSRHKPRRNTSKMQPRT